jgi:hypothetical protein
LYKFTFDIATSVIEVADELQYKLFPNPASEYITISKPSEGFEPSEGSDVKIFNMLGECVMTAPTAHPSTGSGSDNLRIDISHLPRGVYYIRIGSRSKMFVKM